jgi:CheY-like chemotaxis protein
MKILIVDDEPLVRKSLSRACIAKGHKVVDAVDGIDGLAKWTEFDPDVVFLDVLMPGMSGPELLKKMRGIPGRPRARVILMSAYSGEHNIETAQQIGADLFIPKPFDDIFAVVIRADELFAAVEK